MNEGAKYLILLLPEKEQIGRLEAMLERGNHKSTKGIKNEEILLKLRVDSTRMGFRFAVTTETAKKMVKGELYPFGINRQ
eukprot:9552368-Ditylum_brightwellii.AAC.1